MMFWPLLIDLKVVIEWMAATAYESKLIWPSWWVSSLKPGEETFTVILDLKGLALKNLDVRGWISTFDFLQVILELLSLTAI